MDIGTWQSHIVKTGDVQLKRFFDICQTIEHGSRTGWAMNLMKQLVDTATTDGQPSSLPTTPARASDAVMGILAPLSRQLQCKALRMLRLMLSTDTSLRDVLNAMPLHNRREAADVLRRQRKLVKDECMPHNVQVPWVQELFRDIVKLKKSQWKTSATGKQEISMVHKFLRATGWMEIAFDSLDAFKLYVTNEVKIDDVTETCMAYLQKYCAEEASRRRYKPALGNHSND